MNLAQDITYLGVNDHDIDLFEGQFPVPDGISYNSYLITDDKTAVIDSVDMHFTAQWIAQVTEALQGTSPDYLIIHHMEPDHSGSIAQFMATFPETIIVSNAKAFSMMQNFFGTAYEDRQLIVKNDDELSLGTHTLSFTFTPMVHWPEVMMSYDSATGVLFSADAFGTFGALDVEQTSWEEEARRYYFGIVAPYGKQVQAALKKLSGLNIAAIYPLHGPVLTENLSFYLDLYKTWSSYEAETPGVVIACASVYGHTNKAARELADQLKKQGVPVVLHDLTRNHDSYAIANAFRYSTLVCASITYNGAAFPAMQNFMHELAEKKYQNRTVAFIQNGSWAPMATKAMKQTLEGCSDLKLAETEVTLAGSTDESSQDQIATLAQELVQAYQ